MKNRAQLWEFSGRSKKQLYVYEVECKAEKPARPPHWHDEFEIFFTAYDGTIVLDAETVSFEKNSVLFINSGQLHSPVTLRSDGRFFAIVFDFELLDFKNDDFCQTDIFDMLKKKTYLFPRFADLEETIRSEITGIITNIITLYCASVPGWELKMKCGIYEIIFLLYSRGKFIRLKRNNDDCVQMTHVKNAITFMENNYQTSVTIDGLSNSINISKYYLIKIFKQFTGETPMIYLRNLRIDVSKELLAEGYSVMQTALMSGFNNVSYYVRHFKLRNNMTPKEYQKSAGKQNGTA